MYASVLTSKMRPMKKILLAAVVGLTGVLASCGDTGTSWDGYGYYGDPYTGSGLSLNSISAYDTNWHLSSSVQDQSGRTIPAGTAVICDNATTVTTFDINWSGYMRQVGLQLKGLNTGNYKDAGIFNVNSAAGSTSAQISIRSGLAPLNVAPQSITVNPVNVTPNVRVKGYTYVAAQGTDSAGRYSNVVTSGYSIPVLNCQ